jgi:circadian clock protein KaiB
MTKKAAKRGKGGDKKKSPVKRIDSSAQFEKLLVKQAFKEGHYSLRLYITGTTERSNEAVTNIRQLCDKFLPGRYELEVVDIYQQPGKAADAQIIAAPTLVKQLPMPIKRLIGNLSDPEKVIIGLDLREQK